MDVVESLPVLRYYPFVEGNIHAGGKKLIGIKHVDLATSAGFHVDCEFAHQLLHKKKTLEKYKLEVCDVFMEDDTVQQACHEVLSLVINFHEKANLGIVRVDSSNAQAWTVENLVTGERLQCDKRASGSRSARRYLLQAGALCQEDLCVMVYDDWSKEWVLRAGYVAAPYDWKLQQKLGKSIGGIHKPVPGFKRVVAPVKKIFDQLKTGKPRFRGNHGVVLSDELYYMNPPRYRDNQDLHLRVELQTLTKLPRSGAVLFSIRTTVTKLEDLEPTVASDLICNMKSMPQCLWKHRGYDKIGAKALYILTRCAEARVQPKPLLSPLTRSRVYLGVLLILLYIWRKLRAS